MTELELVGYTADMRYLVLSDPNRRGSRWRVPIDEEFLNTVEELVQEEPRGGVPPASNGTASTPGVGPLAAVAAALDEQGVTTPDGELPAAATPQTSSLSPRQIQALLRAGKSPRTVAKQAGTDEAWVRRWLPPIESERYQVLQAVWVSSIKKARLGESNDLVGEAVRKNLTAKGVDPDSDEVQWSATRREGSLAWTVTLRYRSRGSIQRATWRFDPERGSLEARNQLAVDIAWTRSRQSYQGESTTSTPKKSGGKKSAGDQAAAKKSAGKKPAGKKPAGKKPAGKKSAAKKSAGKKAAAKKSAGKQAAAKKSAGKKSAGKQAKTSAGKKSAGKRATAKKSAGKQASGKKVAAKKPGGTNTTAAKATGQKTAAKKAATTKSAGKQASGKKRADQKATGKKSAGNEDPGKKAAAKKSSPARVSGAKKGSGDKNATGTNSASSTPGRRR